MKKNFIPGKMKRILLSSKKRWTNIENDIIRNNPGAKNRTLARMIHASSGVIRTEQSISAQKGKIKRGIESSKTESKHSTPLSSSIIIETTGEVPRLFPEEDNGPLMISFEGIDINGKTFAIVPLDEYEIIDGDSEKTGFVLISKK